MRWNYENCLAITLKWEGGDVNHPADPGGKTRWGITQATYNHWRKSKGKRTRSVFLMTRDEMLAIYKKNYWDVVNGDNLAPGVDLAVYDFGVNSGPARAKRYLRSVLGGTDWDTVKRLCAKRMSFVRGLKTWKVFGRGWSRRIADIEARGVKMALSNSKSIPKLSEKSILAAEVEKANAAAKKEQVKGAGGVGVGGAGTQLADPSFDWTTLTVFGLCALVIGAGVIFFLKARHQRHRAEAYRTVLNNPDEVHLQ